MYKGDDAVQPVLSVAMATFNHAGYIERAVRSVLSQKTSFPIELVIGDDCSTDGTREILESLRQANPNIIHLRLAENNRGAVKNGKDIFENCRGRYIALLEGDDYWNYDNKLQKQFDFLEANPDYEGCFHDAEILSEMENGTRQSLQKYRYYSQFNRYEPDFFPHHLICRNIIPTASLVFRKSDYSDFLNHYPFPQYSFSWALQLIVIAKGKFRYFNECWTVYCDHGEGLSKKYSSTEFTLNNIRIARYFKSRNPYRRHRDILFRAIASEYECIKNHPVTGKLVFRYALAAQWCWFKAFWWGNWYFKLAYLKQLFKV